MSRPTPQTFRKTSEAALLSELSTIWDSLPNQPYSPAYFATSAIKSYALRLPPPCPRWLLSAVEAFETLEHLHKLKNDKVDEALGFIYQLSRDEFLNIWTATPQPTGFETRRAFVKLENALHEIFITKEKLDGFREENP